jgi:hypothetical protein
MHFNTDVAVYNLILKTESMPLKSVDNHLSLSAHNAIAMDEIILKKGQPKK